VTNTVKFKAAPLNAAEQLAVADVIAAAHIYSDAQRDQFSPTTRERINLTRARLGIPLLK
jgi:hypothetical protein